MIGDLEGLSVIQRRRNKGFVLVAMAVSAFALLGAAGLAIDLGRMFITRNEAQTYTDFIALAAVKKLDGSAAGIQAANAQIAASVNRWGFATTAFTGTTMRFSYGSAPTTWISQAAAEAAPVGITNVEVSQLVNNIQMYFLPVITGALTGSAGARSVAGQVIDGTPIGGALPFSPLARDAIDLSYDYFGASGTVDQTIWGWRIGTQITLRMPSHYTQTGNASDDITNDPPGQQNRFCDADKPLAERIAYDLARAASERGYIEENSAAAINSAILGEITVPIGTSVNLVNGVKQDEARALEERVAQDPPVGANHGDTWADYQTYRKNPFSPSEPGLIWNSQRLDRRIGVVPISNSDNLVLGFAEVYLPREQLAGGNRSLCAILIGTASPPGNGAGSGTSGNSGITVYRLLE